MPLLLLLFSFARREFLHSQFGFSPPKSLSLSNYQSQPSRPTVPRGEGSWEGIRQEPSLARRTTTWLSARAHQCMSEAVSICCVDGIAAQPAIDSQGLGFCSAYRSDQKKSHSGKVAKERKDEGSPADSRIYKTNQEGGYTLLQHGVFVITLKHSMRPDNPCCGPIASVFSPRGQKDARGRRCSGYANDTYNRVFLTVSLLSCTRRPYEEPTAL
ncbi:hypothetical protein LX32DRAFT_645208 [Colletotrichum zoysiae]|uniref:Uncharacterized protein n=1 Tax=Colletotrichum zoysiae TaxID=1216348 RepID=A0AAD9H6N0_9PEZI|nr:hypothetical protein LX32DRAFT_645208 [Colletotrichum zoysiae]